jgi:hypothetical protein
VSTLEKRRRLFLVTQEAKNNKCSPDYESFLKSHFPK